jgi:flagellar assembly protein FliH
MSDRRRILAAEDAPALPAWKLPPVVGPLVSRRRDPAPAVREATEGAGFAQGLARGLEEGRAAGYAAGMEEGRLAARALLESEIAAATANVARLEEVLGFLARPLAELELDVERELVTLTLLIAKQLVRRELRLDPAQIIAIIRETVGQLPAAAREVRVHLHPEDAAVVRERLAGPAPDRAWTIVDDPVQGRGGCRVTTDSASIDARLESRIAAVAGAVLGDERGALRAERLEAARADVLSADRGAGMAPGAGASDGRPERP